MGIFDRFKKKKISVEEIITSTTDEEVIDSYIKEAEKATEIVETSIQNGDFSDTSRKIEKLTKEKNERVQFVFDPPEFKEGKLFVFSAIMFICLFFCIGAIGIMIFMLSNEYHYRGLLYIGTSASFLVINIIIIVFTIKRIKFLKRYKAYTELLRYQNLILVDDLVDYSKQSQKIVVSDLKLASKQMLIPEGHFGSDNIFFMVSKELYEQYKNNLVGFDDYYRKQLEERRRMEERPKEIQDILDQGQSYIKAIRESNDLIKDVVISEKLDRLEKVVTMIFYEVDVNPSKVDKLGLFLRYYLPTTDKLLKAYIDASTTMVTGNNSKKMCKEIEETFDMLILSFENILDQFYQEQQMDIVSDIFALKGMLSQNGLI